MEIPEMVKDREPGILGYMGSQRVGHILATEWQQKYTSYKTKWIIKTMEIWSMSLSEEKYMGYVGE